MRTRLEVKKESVVLSGHAIGSEYSITNASFKLEIARAVGGVTSILKFKFSSVTELRT